MISNTWIIKLIIVFSLFCLCILVGLKTEDPHLRNNVCIVMMITLALIEIFRKDRED